MRNGQWALFLAAAAIMVTVTRRASAFGGTAGDLGKAGNFVVTNDASFSFYQPLSNANGPTFRLQPALDYFVVPNVSIGGTLVLGYDSNNKATTVGIAGRVGYEIVLSDTWSFWPRAGLTLTSVSVPAPNSGGGSGLALDVFAPFLVHPAEHFFFGLGPGFHQDIAGNDPKVTAITGGFLIGGYFDS
ncbi:MAG: hypothetical protein M3O50_10840 [Myxococcota bacterium]|nr:hypothetical protein [Myxococcota bacterium]